MLSEIQISAKREEVLKHLQSWGSKFLDGGEELDVELVIRVLKLSSVHIPSDAIPQPRGWDHARVVTDEIPEEIWKKLLRLPTSRPWKIEVLKAFNKNGNHPINFASRGWSTFRRDELNPWLKTHRLNVRLGTANDSLRVRRRVFSRQEYKLYIVEHQ